MATATLKSYLSGLVQDIQDTEIGTRTENLLLPYNLYLKKVHYGFTEYQSNTSQLIYRLAGKYEVEINNRTFYLKAGSISLIKKDTGYTIKVSDKNTIIVKFKLDNDFSWQKQLKQVDANTPNK